MNRAFGNATPEDWPQVEALLGRVALPLDGLREQLGTTLVARQDGKVIGCAALEMYGEFALLRSVAVDKSHQRHGLGHDLARAALDMARQRGVSGVYLLTETAGEFFLRFGFKATGRAEVPAAVQQSVEFTSACPANALVMALPLEQEPISR